MKRMTLTIREVCELFGVSRTLILNLIRNGKLRTIKFGKRVLIPISAVREIYNFSDEELGLLDEENQKMEEE